MQRGVLAAHLVRGERCVEAAARRRDHVEIRSRRLDHEHVRALVEVGRDLGERLAPVARIHLIRGAVTEPRRAVGGVPERPVERGRELRGVREDRRLHETAAVEVLTDRGDAPVHHVRRRDDVGARFRVGPGGRREERQGRVVVDRAPGRDGAAVTVRRVLAEADVGDPHEPR